MITSQSDQALRKLSSDALVAQVIMLFCSLLCPKYGIPLYFYVSAYILLGYSFLVSQPPCLSLFLLLYVSIYALDILHTGCKILFMHLINYFSAFPTFVANPVCMGVKLVLTVILLY